MTERRRNQLITVVVIVGAASALAAGVFFGPHPPAATSAEITQADAPVAGSALSTRRERLFGAVAVGDLTSSEYARAARLGVRIMRVHLNWRWIEPVRGPRNWNYFDTQLLHAAKAGVEVLPLLWGVPDFVSRSEYAPPVKTKRQKNDWKDFVADAVRRYRPGGIFWLLHPEVKPLPIRVWQIGNEPNLPFFFGGKVGVRLYRDWLKISAVAIRGEDPDARVVTAGLFRWQTIPGSISGLTFLKRLYRLRGVRRWFDQLAIHPYGTRPKGVVGFLARVRRFQRARHDARTAIQVTEFGWTTGGKGWRTNNFRATKRQQARWLKRTYRMLLRRRGLNIRTAFWHSYKDFPMPGPDYWTGRMGLLTLKGKRKPSWWAYARVAGGQP